MLLLHGPVGSSKSTIARLLKKGLERYSGTDAGALQEAVGAVTPWCCARAETVHSGPLARAR